MEASYLNGVLITESKVRPSTDTPFTTDERLMHSRMGIITELAELIDIHKKNFFYGKPVDQDHLIEEWGDLAWYVGLGFNVIGIIAANPEMEPVEGDIIPMILESAMKTVTDDTVAFETRLQYVYRCLITCIKMQGLDYQEILDKNLIKLRARYGDSFDADRAINRDVEAEYAAMSQEESK